MSNTNIVGLDLKPSELAVLDAAVLSPSLIDDTLGVVLKYQEDIARVRAEGIERLLSA